MQQVNAATDTYLVKPVVMIQPEADEFDVYNRWLNDK
jgi:hypothetical protein